MRALLQTTLGTVGACMLTAAALTLILGMLAGCGGILLHAAVVGACFAAAFWAVFFLTLVVGHVAGVLEADRPKEPARADQ